MLLIRRMMRLLQNTAMYVCMYVLVAAAAIIWASSSSAGALPLLRHDDHHLHITPKASKQAGRAHSPPPPPPFLLRFWSLCWSWYGVFFQGFLWRDLQPNTKPINLLNSLELLYLQHSPSWTTSHWCKTSHCCKQASKQASIRVGREIIGGGELATNLEVKLEVVFFFRGSLKCFFKYGAQKYSRIWEKSSAASSPLFPSSSSLLQFHQNFSRGASSSKQQILKELCFCWRTLQKP